MTLPQQIAEICRLIHLFQTDIRETKEELFNIKTVTPGTIWNHIAHGAQTRISPQQLAIYFAKHGLNIEGQDIFLLVNVYSSRKDRQLNQGDLWQLFRPLHMRAVQDIIVVRNKRNAEAKCHQVHYKVVDLLSIIIKKTLSFLKVAQKMKINIAKCSSASTQINPLDAAHLQIFVHPWSDTLMKADFEIVLSHIMRNQLRCSKTFWEFMVPVNHNSGKIIHPDHKQKDQLGQWECMLQHHQKVNYVNNSLKKRPLYFLN